MNAVRTSDAKSQTLVSVFFEYCAQLLIGKDLVCLANQMELWQVNAHLGRVLQGVILERILFESKD